MPKATTAPGIAYPSDMNRFMTLLRLLLDNFSQYSKKVARNTTIRADIIDILNEF